MATDMHTRPDPQGRQSAPDQAPQTAPAQSRAPVLGYSIPEVMESTGLSRSTIYQEIANGALKTFKVGRRRLVSPNALTAWIKAKHKAAG